MNIKNDLVVLNYIKENNLVENLKADLVNYYIEHSCASKEDIEEYLSKNFNIGTLLEMLSETSKSVKAKKSIKCEYVEELKKQSNQTRFTTIKELGTKAEAQNQLSEQENSCQNSLYEGTKLNGMKISYKSLKDIDSFEYGGFKFTKQCPDLSGNDVYAFYLTGNNKKEVIDVMFVTLGGKIKSIKDDFVGKYLRNAYSQYVSTSGGHNYSQCKMNNFNRNVRILDKRTGKIYRSKSDAAKAFGISPITFNNRLKTGKIEAEIVK